ncbi:MAG: heavy metal translocating P-type ATPase [Ktedonobacteraceae bacterium]|nr:heavy metal translocating P-type ATPase [Ktedonobacteraceae bacterium]
MGKSNNRQLQVPSATNMEESPSFQQEMPAGVARERKQWLRRMVRLLRRYPIPSGTLLLLAVSLFLWLSGRADLTHWTLLAATLPGGVLLLWQTTYRLFHREFGVDVIAVLAILGSLLMGEYLAGAIVVLMLSGGEALEAFALRRAHSSLTALAERIPRHAHLLQNGQIVDVPAETIQAGMIVVIKPGELIPVDGVVEEGNASVSEADLTGEPLPVRKVPGLSVYSGSVNLDGVLRVYVEKSSAESQYAQIIRLVREAQERKAPIHRLADRYSVVFTALTVLLAGGAWLISGHSIYALAVLVVATPCPLILATPIAIMSGIDTAARHGVIVKSGATVELLGEADVAVFDKTGTLTLGTPQVRQLLLYAGDQVQEYVEKVKEDEILRLVASVELLSNHVLARTIVAAAQERGLALKPARDFVEVFGQGVQGRVLVDERRGGGEEEPAQSQDLLVAVGNRDFMRSLEIALPPALLKERERRTEQGQICSFIALNGVCSGLVVMEDVPRADLARLSPALKDLGIKETILLTGDHERVAQQIGALAGVDRVVARCLPDQKVQVVRELNEQGRRVLMVGDGVNDAPALATASVGIALGTQGLTAAASAADGVLLSTDILRIVTAVRLGRQVMRVARQGIWIGLGLSIIAMFFAAAGYLAPVAGALLQEGIDVLVILNALRAGKAIHR